MVILFKTLLLSLFIALLPQTIFADEISELQELTHEEIIDKIMNLSGLNMQIPQYAENITNAVDFKEYIATLPEANQTKVKEVIALAFDGNTMLETVRDEIAKKISLDDGKDMLRWYLSDEGIEMTAREERHKEKEDWDEIHGTKEDPKPDANRLKLYKNLLKAIHFTKHTTNRRIALTNIIMQIVHSDMTNNEIKRHLQREKRKIRREIEETAILSMIYNLEDASDEILKKYLNFLKKPSTQAYHKGTNSGLIKAISSATKKILLELKPHSSFANLKPKSTKGKRYKKACENGDMQGCTELGYMYYMGQGEKKDYSKVLTPIKMGCDANIAKACAVLSYMYMLGRGVEKDILKSVEYAKSGCHGGYTNVCTNLGAFYYGGEGVKKDIHMAIKYYKIACDAGEAFGCRNIGEAYALGNRIEQNHLKAIEFYALACDGGHMYSCYHNGNYYLEGVHVEQDYNKAKELFSLGCKRNNYASCNILANMYVQGLGVEQDIKKAKNLYSKACSKRYGKACYSLGILYANGINETKNITKAKRLFRKACKYGSYAGCERYQNISNKM